MSPRHKCNTTHVAYYKDFDSFAFLTLIFNDKSTCVLKIESLKKIAKTLKKSFLLDEEMPDVAYYNC